MPTDLSLATDRSKSTRAAVLDAALDVFLDKTFHRATVDDITRRAEVAHGTFYRYFRNKNDVLKALVEQAMSRVPHPDRDLAQTDVLGAISEDIAAFFSNVAAQRDLYRIWREASVYDDEIGAVRRSLRRPFVEKIRDSIQASIGLQMIPPIDTEVAAEALSGMVENFANSWFIEEHRDGDINHLAGTVALIWFRGLAFDQRRHSLRGTDGLDAESAS